MRPGAADPVPGRVRGDHRGLHYLIDPEWGPAFLKVCGYAPSVLKLCLHGHEWAQRQLRRRRIPFT
ncbi:MAG: hypothetical protein HYS14_06575 [Candidatus Rokubacteria bacterium]|nr:hypothetical protein [Candidatus Rokubacteria bacterium]